MKDIYKENKSNGIWQVSCLISLAWKLQNGEELREIVGKKLHRNQTEDGNWESGEMCGDMALCPGR